MRKVYKVVSSAEFKQFGPQLLNTFAHKGFMINSLSPGGVFNAQTNDFLKNYKAKSPQDRLAQSDEIANVVNFLATTAPNHLNGEDIIVDGGFTKW